VEFKLAKGLGRQSRRRIELSDGLASFWLPCFNESFDVRVRDIAAVGAKATFKSGAVAELRRDPVVPRIWTGTNNETPNMVVVFATPQRVPPVRRGNQIPGVSTHETRSPEGLYVDGLRLKAKDPTAVRAAFGAQGVPVTADAGPQLAAAIGPAVGPVARGERETATRSRRRRSVVIGIGSFVAFVALIWVRWTDMDANRSFVTVMAVLGAVLAFQAGAWWFTRRDRHGAPTPVRRASLTEPDRPERSEGPR
jgi:hypothetical protein